MQNTIKDLKIISNTLLYNYWIRQKNYAKPSDSHLLTSILAKYKEEKTVFVHIGLRQIKTAFQLDAYDFILDLLTQNFQSIIAPGFTPSFRQTGLYHKLYSAPEYGKFSKLFLKDATFRTDDPIYSLLVLGDYQFENSYTKEVFGPGGAYDQLDKDNILCLSIGTPWPVSSQKHYIEYRSNLPYVERVTYEGIIYYDEQNHNKIATINYVRKHWFNKYVSLIWNNYKLAKHMKKAGIMEQYNLNGLMIYAFKLRDMRVFIEEKFIKEPYYLFT